ncbi:peptidoglycan-binding domain-containing protein [Streptomyces sp. NPDC005574]|uniref:peptidoglycan-binding domain-containing protein n=1 Tax=Streptomyces sp. NPDC005574 TaxID=3156891 RepID=UPI0033AEF4D6
MPTRPDREQPQDNPVLEPIRVLRPRRTDALAELFREFEQDGLTYESVPLDPLSPGAEDATQELPPVTAGRARPARTGRSTGRVRGRPYAAAVAVVGAAALVGLGCALLLSGRGDASAARPPAASAVPSPAVTTAPAASAAADPDGAGTLREGDSGPEVSDLEQRLLRIPDVYKDGATDGRYDTVLTEAVARFQLWYGIRGDENGVYGDDTRLALESRTQGDG